MTTTAPPQWALSRARDLDGLRRTLESLVEEEAGRPMWALEARLAVIPDRQRQLCLADLRVAEHGCDDAEHLLAAAIERTVKTYDAAMAAAYAPPLTDDEVHDCHTEVTAAMLARAELHPLGDPHRCDVDARIDELVALLNDGPDLFGAAANYATAAELRARPLPQRVPGASLAANPPPDVDQREVA